MNTRTINFPQRAIVSFLVLNLILIAGAIGVRASTSGDLAILDRSSKAFVNVVKKAKPAVVHIKVEKTTKSSYGNRRGSEEMFNHPFFEQFFGPNFRPQQQPRQREHKQSGQGSGFIISKEGLILTNNHVVEDADSITVILSDNRDFVAKVIGTDPKSDIALIKIEDPENLPVLPLGDSSALEAGEWVIAIGNPFGLSQTVTVGVVSATGRNGMGINEYENFIQTDAAINPGNSGGPLLNGRGEAVGINTALFSRTGGYMGIGFAIPINMVKSIEDQLQKHGKVTRGWLGVGIQNMTKNLAESFGLKRTDGILLSGVQQDSPASAAGLKQGDVIIRMGDVPLKNVSDLRNKVALTAPGTKTMLRVIRQGREKKIQVTIGEQPANFGQGNSGWTEKNSLDQFGLTLQELSPELAERFDYEKNSGLIISDIKSNSPAAVAGLKPGQLVEEVNRQKVNTLKELKQAAQSSTKSGKILLRIRSGEFSTYVVLTKK